MHQAMTTPAQRTCHSCHSLQQPCTVNSLPRCHHRCLGCCGHGPRCPHSLPDAARAASPGAPGGPAAGLSGPSSQLARLLTLRPGWQGVGGAPGSADQAYGRVQQVKAYINVHTLICACAEAMLPATARLQCSKCVPTHVSSVDMSCNNAVP
jgi:hypothetical protein